MKERLVVDLTAGRQPEGKIFDCSSHGYSVYYNGNNAIVNAFLKSACGWEVRVIHIKLRIMKNFVIMSFPM